MRFAAAAIFFSVAIIGCTESVPPIYEEPIPFALKSAKGSLAPRLTKSMDDTVLLSWMERLEQGARLMVSELADNGWSEPVEVVRDPAMFVNWADIPSVRAYVNTWTAHWLSYSADLPYAYDVRFAWSLDHGNSWSGAISPHDDGTPTEHGFVSQFPMGDAWGLVWLDGRNTLNEVSEDPQDSGMTLRAAVVAPDRSVDNEQQIDGLICDCCQTDVALSSKGPIAVYRDRTPEEIRDISLSRFRDGRWQPGEPFSNDGWEISGCPVNGPAIAASGNNVAVAWFTAANDIPKVLVRLSSNGGDNFGDPIEVTIRKTSGHVDVAWIGDDAWAVSYLRALDGTHNVLVRSVTMSGKLGAVKTVARTEAPYNVPQMVFRNGNLIFSWTDDVNGQSRVYSARVEIAYAE